MKVSGAGAVMGAAAVSSSFLADFGMEDTIFQEFGGEEQEGRFRIAVRVGSHSASGEGDRGSDEAGLRFDAGQRIAPLPERARMAGQLLREAVEALFLECGKQGLFAREDEMGVLGAEYLFLNPLQRGEELAAVFRPGENRAVIGKAMPVVVDEGSGGEAA